MTNLEQEREIFTLELLTERINYNFEMKGYYSDDVEASSLQCNLSMMRKLYPDEVNNVINEAVKAHGMINLKNKYLSDDTIKYLSKFSSDKKSEDAITTREFDEEESKVVTPLQIALDVMDPGMFTFADVKLVDDNTCAFICIKNKPGKANVVDKINALKSKELKCNIDSTKLVINATKEGFDVVLDFIATILEAEKAKGETIDRKSVV